MRMAVWSRKSGYWEVMAQKHMVWFQMLSFEFISFASWSIVKDYVFRLLIRKKKKLARKFGFVFVLSNLQLIFNS